MPTQKYVQDARLNCTVIQAISSTLNTLQKRSGCSQEKFARLIGVTPLTYRFRGKPPADHKWKSHAPGP